MGFTRRVRVVVDIEPADGSCLYGWLKLVDALERAAAQRAAKDNDEERRKP